MGLYKRGINRVLRNPGDLLYLDASGNPAAASSTNASGALTATSGVPTFLGGGGGTPPSNGVDLPVGALTSYTSSQWYRNASAPQTISGMNIHDINTAAVGLGIMQWPPVKSPSAFTVTDIVTQNIGNNPPTSNGTSEAGIWFGQQVNANRIVCDGTWEGLWTGAECCDSVIQNFTIGKADASGGYSNAVAGIGLYCEHFTRRVTFTNFAIKSTGNGINVEWWYADTTYGPIVASEYPTALSGKAGSCYLTFQNGTIYCPAGKYGIFMDAGTWACTVKNITFTGPGNAIAVPNNLAGPVANTIDQASCTFNNSGNHVTFHNNAIG